MIKINKIDNEKEYFEFFSKINDGDADLDIVVWQLHTESNERKYYKATLETFEVRSEEMVYCSDKDESFSFLPEDIYFYIENLRCIFKAEQVSIQNNMLTVKFPDDLQMLDDYDNSRIKTAFVGIDFALKVKEDIGEEPVLVTGEPEELALETKTFNVGTDTIETKWFGQSSTSDKDRSIFEQELSFITLDEEDERYEDSRETPRARPPEGKLATIQVADGSRSQMSFPLHDLSQGGLSFLVFAKEDFIINENVYVKAFDTKTFDNPIFGIVRSIKEADEMGIQYKVGVQFLEEEVNQREEQEA